MVSFVKGKLHAKIGLRYSRRSIKAAFNLI
jgi:hypothetical protein